MNRGVTVVELLLIIAVLILAGGLIKLHFLRMEERTELFEAKSDLKQIKKHIEILHDHTGMDPGHVSRDPCVQAPAMFLNSCEAGLECTDGAFPNWQGPYMEVPRDPWGSNYYFDADYLCVKESSGCEGVPNTTKVRAILSPGPDGNLNSLKDNIVHIICK